MITAFQPSKPDRPRTHCLKQDKRIKKRIPLRKLWKLQNICSYCISKIYCHFGCKNGGRSTIGCTRPQNNMCRFDSDWQCVSCRNGAAGMGATGTGPTGMGAAGMGAGGGMGAAGGRPTITGRPGQNSPRSGYCGLAWADVSHVGSSSAAAANGALAGNSLSRLRVRSCPPEKDLTPYTCMPG